MDSTDRTPRIRRLKNAALNQKGFALITVLILTSVGVTMGLAFFKVAQYELNHSEYQRDYAQSLWACETALDRGVVFLEAQKQPPRSTYNLYSNMLIGDAKYDLTIIPDPANQGNPEKIFTLRAIARCGRAARQVEERVRLEGFARYGYFSDEEGAPGSPIWFFTGDDLGGKIHSNSTMHISGTPRFRGPVTSASDHMVAYPGTNVYNAAGWPSGSNNPKFDQGFDLGIDEIELPADTGDLRVAAIAGGLNLTGDYEIVFEANGDLTYRKWSAPNPSTTIALSSLTSGVIHVTGNARLKGVVKGQVTVGASKNVEITGDLLYAAANTVTGQPFAGCTDLTGIVAGKNIIIRNIDPDTHTDMVVDATVMALNTSFGAENYNTGGTRGTLHLWGGLIQQRRGAVGTFGNGVLKNGYLKDYHYDTRVTAQPPPEFPLTGKYTRISWTEGPPS